jgi:AcrR family transcriptional regulator
MSSSKKDTHEDRDERKRREYRRLILKAAERIIVRKGLSAVTMDDVAREADFSKATLYRYFGGKSELVLEILTNFFDEIAQGVSRIANRPASAREKLKEGIRFYLKYNQQKENVSRMMILDREFQEKISIFVADERRLTSASDLKFLKEMRDKHKGILDTVAGIIGEGVASGEFREVDVASAVIALESLLEGFCHLRPLNDRPYTVREATEFIHEFFLRGIERVDGAAKGES